MNGAKISARVLLLGGGNMGAAMARGWLDILAEPGNILVIDPQAGVPLQPLLAKGVRHAATVPDEVFDIVVLAVKPQIMAAALPALKPALRPDTLVISVAAGKTIDFITERLGSLPIVRTMPNTPALIGRGITGAFANSLVDARLRDTASALLAASGAVEWLDSEDEIDAVVGVSGSGPAYVFLMAEVMAAAGEKLGLKPELAMRLAQHTIAGAGELMLQASDEPAQLRRNVTSPKGTTQAALEVLMADNGLAPLLEKAIAAAVQRSRELSQD
ncbi:pyrroline-5-carboxylate reductase [Aureimonas fodinaquatilis]|uniref:Pyrroline-5-carboxylate reductase n=1 Tax=Aureimonas fodinaquatilis TaxID=2565783 RepID=A0A5B0E0G9_9HYPH|nr:pyrroline-5-carboxylate reductase [Aureimonas fodinaquatilis]KAA0971782.1 pyrroline-5-carboxylate reductase [Aureimonas fodinaquatilis]